MHRIAGPPSEPRQLFHKSNNYESICHFHSFVFVNTSQTQGLYFSICPFYLFNQLMLRTNSAFLLSHCAVMLSLGRHSLSSPVFICLPNQYLLFSTNDPGTPGFFLVPDFSCPYSICDLLSQTKFLSNLVLFQFSDSCTPTISCVLRSIGQPTTTVACIQRRIEPVEGALKTNTR